MFRVTSPHEKRQARRTEIIRRLTELAPRKRLDAMLEEVDGRTLVQSLPAEDVYGTIIDVGLADSVEIVRLATPEQFRTFVDLAAWQKDRLDPIEVLHWLRAARDDDDEAFHQKLKALDVEVMELIYKKLAVIHELEDDPNTEGVVMETPDGKYLIEFTLEGVDEAALRRLTFDLIAKNPFEISRFLEAVRWELPTEIEEAAFQFRQARLQDLGFPSTEEAARLLAWRDPDKVSTRTPRAGLAATQSHVDHVAAAFRGLDTVERQNLEGEVRYLVNCLLIAEAGEPGDPAAVKRYSEIARDYLDLGLEHLTGGDADQASEVVREVTLREIFQIGLSLTLKVKRAAEKLLTEPSAKFGDTVLALDEEAAAIAAMTRRRPLKAVKVPGAEPVCFRSKRELAEALAVLDRIRQQRLVLQGLLGSSPVEVIARFGVSLAQLTPQRLFAAVVARAELDEVIDAAPIAAERLQELAARLFVTEPTLALAKSAGQRSVRALSQRLSATPADVEAMVQRVLSVWLADLGPMWLKDLRIDAKRVLTLPVTGEMPV